MPLIKLNLQQISLILNIALFTTSLYPYLSFKMTPASLYACPTGIWGSDGLSLSLGRALYNSTDSLDSAKAVTIAMEAAAMAMAGKRHPSTDSHSSVMTCDKAVLVSKAEEYLKTPRSSIGIQVKCNSLILHHNLKRKLCLFVAISV